MRSIKLTRINVSKLFALFFLIVLAFGIVIPQSVHALPFDTGEIDAYIGHLMDTYAIPGAAIALVKDGKVLYTKGYGVRNVNTGQPVTDHTLFSIGSISKSFTSLAVAQLVDAGKLKLDDRVVKYVPDLKLSDPDTTASLTIRQLLTQTSGLPRVDDLWLPKAPRSSQQVVHDLAKVKLIAPPGATFWYSNQNYVLLGYLVERVTGQSWEAYVQAHILKPLHMDSTDFDARAMENTPDHAEPHILDERAGKMALFYNPVDVQWSAAHEAAVAINADAVDMAQYVKAQLGGDNAVISPAMLAEMHQPAVNIAPLSSLVSQEGYALGWFTETYRDHQLVEHSGDVKGFAANVTLVPSANVGVVLLTNTETVETFRQAARLRLVEILLGLPPTQDIATTLDRATNLDPVERLKDFDAVRAYRADPIVLKKLAGDYTGAFGNTHIDLQGDRLFARREGWLVIYEVALYAPDRVLYAAGSLCDSFVLTFKIDAENGVKFYLNGREVLKSA